MADTGDQTTTPLALAARLYRVRPRVLAITAILVFAALGWVYLGLMVAAATQATHALGPGMGFIDLVSTGRVDAISRALFAALCRPSFGEPAVDTAFGGWIANVALTCLMWSAMAFAMMLPTAAPMILTYTDIAETAEDTRERTVSPLVLAAGYMTVWLGFAVPATLLQHGLMRLALVDPGLVSASALFSGAIFIGAGAYQFSPLKHACVALCQRPFPYLLTNWSTEPAAVFRLGLRQGLYCLGCCWAMMLVMFAVGVMNVVWMAIVGVIMAVEKLASTTRSSRAIGVGLVAVGAIFVASSIIAHWPS